MRVSLQLNNFALGKLPHSGGVNESFAEKNNLKNNNSNPIDLNKSPNSVAFMGISAASKEAKDEAYASKYALGVVSEITKTPFDGALFVKTKGYDEEAYEENLHNYIRNNLKTVLQGGIKNPDDYPTSMQKIKGLDQLRKEETYFAKHFYYALWDVLKEKYHVEDSERKMPMENVGFFPYEELVMAEKAYGLERKQDNPQKLNTKDAINNKRVNTYALWALLDTIDFYGCDTGVKSNDKGIVDIKGTGQEMVDIWYSGDINLKRMLAGYDKKLEPDMRQRYDAFVYLKENCGTVGEYIYSAISKAVKEAHPLPEGWMSLYLPIEPPFPIDELEAVLEDKKLRIVSAFGECIPRDHNVIEAPEESEYEKYFWYYN